MPLICQSTVLAVDGSLVLTAPGGIEARQRARFAMWLVVHLRPFEGRLLLP